VQRLLEEEKIDANADFPNDGICEFCDRNQATSLCSACNQIICNDCKKRHKKIKFAVNHEFVSLDQYDPKKKPQLCPIHPELEFTFFCKLNVCAMCATIDHNGHDTILS